MQSIPSPKWTWHLKALKSIEIESFIVHLYWKIMMNEIDSLMANTSYSDTTHICEYGTKFVSNFSNNKIIIIQPENYTHIKRFPYLMCLWQLINLFSVILQLYFYCFCTFNCSKRTELLSSPTLIFSSQLCSAKHIPYYTYHIIVRWCRYMNFIRQI